MEDPSKRRWEAACTLYRAAFKKGLAAGKQRSAPPRITFGAGGEKNIHIDVPRLAVIDQDDHTSYEPDFERVGHYAAISPETWELEDSDLEPRTSVGEPPLRWTVKAVKATPRP